MPDSVSAQGDQSFAVGGDVTNSVVVTGSNNRVTVTTPSVGQSVVDVFALVPPCPPLVIGRDSLLADLKARLGVSPSRSIGPNQTNQVAVTALVGKPGVGKSTLAIALAYDADVLKRFSGGVLWASLGPAPSIDDVLNRWADALGVDATKEPTTEARARRVQAALRGRPFLIVLDDVWSIEGADRLRAVTGPSCAHVLTTRDEAIARRFAPGTVIPIGELNDNDAVALLASLCPAPVSSDVVTLRRLVSAVGGLPLALTLIAGFLAERVFLAAQARSAVEALADAEVWLGLRDSERRLPLGAVIALSVDALSDDAQRAFALLGVFAPKPASCSLAAATAVTEVSEDPLGELVRRNLLEVVGAGRFTLHQTIASVATQRASRDASLIEARRRHANYYCDVAAANRGAWQRIEEDLPQIRHAWSWLSGPDGDASLVVAYAQNLRDFQDTRGLWREEIAWSERALVVARAESDRENEGRLLTAIGLAHDRLGDHRQALALYEQALPIVRTMGQRAGEAAILNNMGLAFHGLGDAQHALESFNQALVICQELGDGATAVTTTVNVALVFKSFGERRQALALYEQALSFYRKVNDRLGMAVCLSNVGSAYIGLGEYRQALDVCQEALVICRDLGDRLGEATSLNNLAMAYDKLGEPQRAVEFYRQALAIYQGVGDRANEANTLNNIGLAYANFGDQRQAIVHLELALPISREIGDRAREAAILNNFGLVYSNLGERPRALEFCRQSLAISRMLGDRAGEAATLAIVALIHIVDKDLAEAVEVLAQVVAIEEAIESPELPGHRAAYEEAQRMLAKQQRSSAVGAHVGRLWRKVFGDPHQR